MSEQVPDDFARVLAAFPAPPRETYGRELSQRTGLGSGRVYQALLWLENNGYVASRWEDPVAAARRPRAPRRFYRLTDDGTRELVEQRRGQGAPGRLGWEGAR